MLMTASYIPTGGREKAKPVASRIQDATTKVEDATKELAAGAKA